MCTPIRSLTFTSLHTPAWRYSWLEVHPAWVAYQWTQTSQGHLHASPSPSGSSSHSQIPLAPSQRKKKWFYFRKLWTCTIFLCAFTTASCLCVHTKQSKLVVFYSFHYFGFYTTVSVSLCIAKQNNIRKKKKEKKSISKSQYPILGSSSKPP